MEACRYDSGRESRDGGELFELVVTASERDSAPMHEE